LLTKGFFGKERKENGQKEREKRKCKGKIELCRSGPAGWLYLIQTVDFL
jgi:hypothetical protein